VYHKANYVLAISPADTIELSKRYKNVHHITAFHPNTAVTIDEGLGNFCLYHGNLEVGENNEAALYLVNEIFSKTDIPLIIAGKNPSKELKSAIANHKHIELKANIPTKEIDDLIRLAQINILPTFQATGIKLKLLAALFNGRHCIVNSPMVVNTGLENLCSIKNSVPEILEEVKHLFVSPFNQNDKLEREKILLKEFSNEMNVKKIIALMH